MAEHENRLGRELPPFWLTRRHGREWLKNGHNRRESDWREVGLGFAPTAI